VNLRRESRFYLVSMTGEQGCEDHDISGPFALNNREGPLPVNLRRKSRFYLVLMTDEQRMREPRY